MFETAGVAILLEKPLQVCVLFLSLASVVIDSTYFPREPVKLLSLQFVPISSRSLCLVWQQSLYPLLCFRKACIIIELIPGSSTQPNPSSVCTCQPSYSIQLLDQLKHRVETKCYDRDSLALKVYFTKRDQVISGQLLSDSFWISANWID